MTSWTTVCLRARSVPTSFVPDDDDEISPHRSRTLSNMSRSNMRNETLCMTSLASMMDISPLPFISSNRSGMSNAPANTCLYVSLMLTLNRSCASGGDIDMAVWTCCVYSDIPRSSGGYPNNPIT
jgi:hypothetical protein